MSKLVIRLKKPVVELVVEDKAVDGVRQKITVGFKRYEKDERDLKITEFDSIQKEENFDVFTSNAFENFLKDQIVYIKQASFELEDSETGKTIKMTVPDTRTVKPYETLWETPDECLSTLVDAYLQWASWRVSLSIAAQKALIDIGISEEAKVKNL